jgi:hypothetical protein
MSSDFRSRDPLAQLPLLACAVTFRITKGMKESSSKFTNLPRNNKGSRGTVSPAPYFHSWQLRSFSEMAAKSLRSFQPLNRYLQNASTRNPARIPGSVEMSTIASFKIPKVSNEPNVSTMCELIDWILKSNSTIMRKAQLNGKVSQPPLRASKTKLR